MPSGNDFIFNKIKFFDHTGNFPINSYHEIAISGV
jgi:hypothetical protein